VGDHRAPDIERGGGQLACSERPTVGSERLELRPVGIVPQGILGAGIEVLIWHWAGSPQGGQDGEPLHRAVERVVHRGGEQAHQLDLGAFALVLLCPPVQIEEARGEQADRKDAEEQHLEEVPPDAPTSSCLLIARSHGWHCGEPPIWESREMCPEGSLQPSERQVPPTSIRSSRWQVTLYPGHPPPATRMRRR